MARIRAIVVAFAASASVALLLASTLAIADGSDADGDGVPDGLEAATERTVAATASGDEFNISSRLDSGRLDDQFEVSYKAGTFQVSYDQTGGGDSSYELELRNLVEWVDTNGDGRIDGGDQIVASTILGGDAFGNVPILRSNTSNADGGRVNNFVIRSNAGEVTLNVTIAQRFMRLSPVRVLTPMEVKIDITINHVFAHPGASVGIEMRMDTEGAVQSGNRSWDALNGFAKDEGSLSVTEGSSDRSATVFFSWANVAVADGREIPVALTSVAVGSHSSDLYLAYPMAPQNRVKIVHDPSLGVESGVYRDILGQTPELQGDIGLYAGTLSVMAVLVAITIVFANRRHKKREV